MPKLLHDLRAPLTALTALAAALVVALVAVHFSTGVQVPASPEHSAQQTVDQRGVRIPPPQPPTRPQDMIAKQNPKGFQLLISYVDSRFEPTTATIKSGDTVRFTNNSTGNLWIAAGGKRLYPRAGNDCGSSALDSCRALHPGEYWEFTFTELGTWDFVNNLDKSQTGLLTIVVQ